MAVPLVPGPGLGDANAAQKSMSTLPENQCDFCAVLIEPKQPTCRSTACRGSSTPAPAARPTPGCRRAGTTTTPCRRARGPGHARTPWPRRACASGSAGRAGARRRWSSGRNTTRAACPCGRFPRRASPRLAVPGRRRACRRGSRVAADPEACTIDGHGDPPVGRGVSAPFCRDGTIPAHGRSPWGPDPETSSTPSVRVISSGSGNFDEGHQHPRGGPDESRAGVSRRCGHAMCFVKLAVLTLF